MKRSMEARALDGWVGVSYAVMGCGWRQGLTSVMSIIKGLISGRASFCTAISSSMVLHTTYTMKPLRSRSREIALVIGSDGEPAITTTSSLAPF